MWLREWIERYSMGDRTPGLRRDADGGLTVAIQHEEPAEPERRANWLPEPSRRVPADSAHMRARHRCLPTADTSRLRFAKSADAGGGLRGREDL